jgi:CheY-like chemotaxis protein
VPGPSAPALAAAGAASAVESILAKPLRGAEVASALSRFAGLPAASGPVLVIDDDPLALDLMRTVLQSIGLTTVGHVDGRQALLEIDAVAPCAIVLDLMMPGFDGYAVLDALRALPRWRDTPVFIWTSLLLTDEEHAELARSARAILNKGGGALTVVLERLSLWRPEEGRAVSASVASEPSAGPD